MKFFAGKLLRLKRLLIAATAMLVFGCNIVKTDKKTPTLLKTENASQQTLVNEVNRFAKVNSMRAKMYLKFEDNSFAEFGSKEVYRQADGEVVVQRPGKILLKVQVPVIHSDVAQMTSDGEKFRVAILNAGSCTECKKFVMGTNNADYSQLQKNLKTSDRQMQGTVKQNVNAFANLRPQHFTDAMLVRPTDMDKKVYTQSSTFQIEEDESVDKKSPLHKVMRGYYLLDEYGKKNDGDLKIERRFWFDRVGGIRLARQQIFDSKGEIESDIIYGKEGNLGESGNYPNLPLEIQVTRPLEKYSMKLTYQTPETVAIGNTYPDAAFVLENSWHLEVIDLDRRLHEASVDNKTAPVNAAGTKFQ